MSADVWESHDRVTGPYCRTCGSDSVGCSDCHEAELATLRTTLAQVTAERDAWKQKATDEESAHALVAGALVGNERSLAKLDRYRVERDQARKQLATLRADLAAQVEGMEVWAANEKDYYFSLRSGPNVSPPYTDKDEMYCVLRNDVLTLLRGPHAD